MSRRTETVKILSYVKTHIEDVGNKVKYPNQPFSAPATGAYVNVLIAPIDSNRENLGDQFLVRCHGILQFDIYAKTDSGSKAMDDLEDLITDKFSDLRMMTSDNEPIVIQHPRPVFFSPKEGLARKSLQFAFYRDEVRTTQVG